MQSNWISASLTAFVRFWSGQSRVEADWAFSAFTSSSPLSPSPRTSSLGHSFGSDAVQFKELLTDEPAKYSLGNLSKPNKLNLLKLMVTDKPNNFIITIVLSSELSFKGSNCIFCGWDSFVDLHAYCNIVIIGQYTPNPRCPHWVSRNLIIILFIHNPMISYQTMRPARFVCKTIPGHDDWWCWFAVHIALGNSNTERRTENRTMPKPKRISGPRCIGLD